ncbi:MAG: penicillin-binding transpeptidase domain-containing protein [Polyangiaceae bacterium]|nr:penicillin-binding transpeptidase domain-containing protein [Polyangiaceae bacterium]
MKLGSFAVFAPLFLMLGAAAPEERKEAGAPVVDLQHIRWVSGKAQARTESGDIAELTLQQKYQEQAEALLARTHARAAAAIVIDIKSAKVLVWAHTSKIGKNLLLSAETPSASLFKIVTTAALLERSRVTPRWEVCSAGGEHGINSAHLTPPREGVKECGPFWQALGFSRNAAYAQLATRYLDPPTIEIYGTKFGFNQALAFDVTLPMGTLTVPEQPLALARTAIGFENSKLSLLGATQLTHIVALGGLLPRVRIVERAGLYQAANESSEGLRVLREVTVRRLRKMLEVTIHSGTSREAFTNSDGQNYLGDIQAAGKTGTLDLGAEGPTASWFSGFAPSEKPEVLVGVLLHNERVWHRKANEVARDLFRIYFADAGARGVTSPFASPVHVAGSPKSRVRQAAASHPSLN